MHLLFFLFKGCRPGKTQSTADTHLVGKALDYRSELDKIDPFTFKEVIHIEGSFGRFPGNTGQHVILDLVFLQQPQAPQPGIEVAARYSPACVPAEPGHCA